MLDLYKNKLRLFPTQLEKYNHLREWLQWLVLKILDEKGYFRQIAFVGGTALRVLYNLKRFSEDLDFCLINRKAYSFSEMMKVLEKELRLNNLSVDIRYKDQKTVASAFIKFDQVLHELNLAQHKTQKIMIKFEVDQNTPLGYHTEFTMINKDYLMGINHFDLPTLFAGKLHALLCRKYEKGRDYYDLIWYIGKKIEPNYEFLNQAILQTEHKNLEINSKNLTGFLQKKINETNFSKIHDDIQPFLEDPKEIRFFDKKIFLELVDQLHNYKV